MNLEDMPKDDKKPRLLRGFLFYRESRTLFFIPIKV